jgi:hypothetical protein
MPGDPKECREHARRCAELASGATTPEAREQFISLRLGIECELDKARGSDRCGALRADAAVSLVVLISGTCGSIGERSASFCPAHSS